MPLKCAFALSYQVLQASRFNSLLKTSCLLSTKYRCMSQNQTKPLKVLKNEKEKLRLFVVQKYINYVNNYTKVLEVRFPTAVKMYRVFSVGIKEFLSDLKTYISLRLRLTKDRGFTKMRRQEIELYQKMPSDMWRIAPVLILSAIPFGNYLIFPLAFLRPRKLLCSHFWSIQQRIEFGTQDLVERLKNNKPVFRSLQAKVNSIPESEIKEKWLTIVALLGSGVHPTVEDILACKELFVNEPYQLSSLTYAHMGHLLKMHGLRKSILRTNKLKYHAFILMEMDNAILREGGIDALNADVLRYVCYIRGLNGSHLTNQEMKDWLEKWMQISQIVDKTSYSLLLHAPIFLAYNHPQNWVLIY